MNTDGHAPKGARFPRFATEPPSVPTYPDDGDLGLDDTRDLPAPVGARYPRPTAETPTDRAAHPAPPPSPSPSSTLSPSSSSTLSPSSSSAQTLGRFTDRSPEPVPMTGPEPVSEQADEQADDLVIRPFLLTRGRTRPRDDGLRLETLIIARLDADSTKLRFEARRIVELSRRPISLAEVAAALQVPIGVARVLVGDLIDDATVSAVAGEELSVRLLERIRDRVRAL